MRRIFVPFRLSQGRVQLTGEIAHRLLRVLRLQIGDLLILFDPNGEEWVAKIIASKPELVEMQLMERSPSQREHPIVVGLFQAIPKGERMDFIVQKATELGVRRIVPMLTRRTVVQLSAERAKAKRNRWERIAQAAAEQCGGQFVPEIALPQTFQQALQEAAASDVWLLFYEAAEEPLRNVLEECKVVQNVAVMVGPEGGFDPEEVITAQQHGARLVSLGKRILRTETAAIIAVALVLYELGVM